MPSALTYPGVYIEEIPSGVRTIVGVGTSIAAFVGRAKRGPTNTPIVINGYADFERRFGGLWIGSSLGYAIRDFYLNGGSQAVIVRVFGPDEKPGGEKTKIVVGGITLVAIDEGTWGKDLRAEIDLDVSKSAAESMGLAPGDLLFNLTVRDTGTDEIEKFRNLTLDGPARRIADVVNSDSALVRCLSVPKADDAVLFEAALKKITDAAKVTTDKTKALSEAKADLAKKEDALNEATKKLAAVTAVKPQVKKDIDEATAALNKANTDLADALKSIEATDKDFNDALNVLVDPMTGAEAQLTRAETDRLRVKTVAGKDAADGRISGAKSAIGAARTALSGSDGQPLKLDDFNGVGKQTKKEGLYALDDADLFNILCIPPYTAEDDVDLPLITDAAQYCERRRAMFLVDPPSSWANKESAKAGLGDIGTNSKNAALFFPRLVQADSLRDGQLGNFVPCGAVAGIFARTDTTRGVWKAPAGFEATLVGVPQLSVPLTDGENGELNPLGINCLRSMPAAGRIVWGSRTLQGDDRLASEWKYIPVRRTALFIEESLYRGTHWVVFEPNDEPLWAQIRLNIGAFMNDLFRQGAFQGQTPREAYFVKCDKETTTQNDIDKGIVNIRVGFAPLKPAEFVVIKLQQIAGEIQT
ncbi:phage tail sheath C-terminal domain-containing protein [Rhizobium leguminosarum]|uniref:phage tail sheath C-terminal domain-containing protein n=1 Tax=Rhizobium leguminosarum TaxID=384 RepID=UPI00140FBAD9|nr:phage tail sheath C-terminal domain-containing protein [Rhizobium leguminosarum]QIO61597.1 phage tail sheath family protein [Rhizobium leguminosarum bv. trifolii]